MSEIANPVRRVHQHLREAGALLKSDNLDRALAAVDAALAIDAESLPAQALRERVLAAQRRGAARPAPTLVKKTPQAAAQQPFVPSGVDAQSWLGFEQRIQERRFNALMEQAQRALASGDGVAALVALEEARELRPNSPEVADLSERVALLPIAVPGTASSSNFALGARGLGAVGMLAAGVALLMGIEWMHPSKLADRAVTPVATARAAAAAIVQAQRSRQTAPANTVTTPTPTIPTTPTVEADAIVSERPVVAEQVVVAEQPRPVATSGNRRTVNIDRPAVGGPAAKTTFQRAALVEPTVSTNRGEVPDDYVAPQPRRPSYTNDGPAVTASPDAVQTPVVAGGSPVAIPLASAPAPPPVVAAVAPRTNPQVVAAAPRPTPPAVAAASVVLPSSRADETRVAQVLSQYARAYGQLNASAAREIWPSVDERALARAFAGLESQALSFDDCNVDVRGATATASCRGRTSYVGKIGSREPRTEQREWTFELRRGSDDAWKIERAKAQRME